MINNILKVKKQLDSKKNKCYNKNIKKVVDQKKEKEREKMKNNKGFSLVELIIVIAIMAILVGVMAPQLIKYIEKSNVSSDTQLCDSVRTAITTAMMDPAVINASGYTAPTGSALALSAVLNSGGTKFTSAVLDTLGVTGTAAADVSSVTAQLKSTMHNGSKADNITVDIVNNNNVIVYVKGGCGNGLKTSCGSTCSGLYAGAVAPANPN